MRSGTDRIHSARASTPARICLGGENLDWMGGAALTAALRDVRLTATATATVGARVSAHYHAPGFEHSELLEPGREASASASGRYVLGCLAAMADVGYRTSGIELDVASAIPMAGGLASSAALCVATVAAIAALHGQRVNAGDTAALAFAAEHDHLGIQCGPMDQYAIALGGWQYLDCSTNPPRATRLNGPGDLAVVVGASRGRMGFDEVFGDLRARRDAAEPSLLRYIERSSRAIEVARAAFAGGDGGVGVLTRVVAECDGAATEDLGISNPELRRWAEAAKSAGALCAKSSGMRARGGSMFALCRSEDCDAVAAALQEHDATVRVSRVDDRGARLDG